MRLNLRARASWLAGVVAFTAAQASAAPLISIGTAADSGPGPDVSNYQEVASEAAYEKQFKSSFNFPGFARSWSYADVGGTYYIKASAAGQASSSSSAILQYTVSNTSTSDMAFTMSLHVFEGFLQSLAYGGSFGTGEYLRSGYSLQVLADGANVFNSSAELHTTGAGSALTLGGTRLTDLNDDATDNRYEWLADDYSILLGVIAAGGSKTVVTTATSWADADVGTYEATSWPYLLTQGCHLIDTPTCVEGEGMVGFGDPASFDAADPDPAAMRVSFTATSVAPNHAVAEPGSLGLLGLGLGVAGWLRNRRLRKPHKA